MQFNITYLLRFSRTNLLWIFNPLLLFKILFFCLFFIFFKHLTLGLVIIFLLFSRYIHPYIQLLFFISVYFSLFFFEFYLFSLEFSYIQLFHLFNKFIENFLHIYIYLFSTIIFFKHGSWKKFAFFRKIFHFFLFTIFIFFFIGGSFWAWIEPSWSNWWFGEDLEEINILIIFFLSVTCLHTLTGFRFDFLSRYKYFFVFFLSLTFLNFFYFFYSRHSIFSFYNNLTFVQVFLVIFMLHFSYVNWYAFIVRGSFSRFFLFPVFTNYLFTRCKYLLYKSFYSIKFNFSDNLIFYGISSFIYMFVIFWPIYMLYCLPIFFKIFYFLIDFNYVLYSYISYFDLAFIWLIIFFERITSISNFCKFLIILGGGFFWVLPLIIYSLGYLNLIYLGHLLLFDFLLLEYFTSFSSSPQLCPNIPETGLSYALVNLADSTILQGLNVFSVPLYGILADTDFFFFNSMRELYMLNNFHLFVFNISNYFYIYIKDSFFFFINFFFLTLLFFFRLHRNTSVWGDLSLLQFYPRNWQGSMHRSMHPWLLHMSVWHYWFWFSFIFVMNLFFIYIFRALTHRRADVRGVRSTGEKRRIAWPEMLIVLFPLFWAVNIVTNAFAYLRLLEGSSGYVLLSVQVSAYQWGWKYCYGDTFYPKFFKNPIKVGVNSTTSLGYGLHNVHRDVEWRMQQPYATKEGKTIEIETPEIDVDGNPVVKKYTSQKFDPIKTAELRATHDVTQRENQDLMAEVYFCRWWLKQSGVLEDERKNLTMNRLHHSGYWVTAQGVDPNTPTLEDLSDGSKKLVTDPLRLLRSTGALVLPTRSVIRLMSCSEDITHSWAVPGIGLKMDCVPGRLFCVFTNIVREGMYFGQCSELCGWNHYNMPVIVYALPVEHFIVWWEMELHAIFTEPFENFGSYFPEEKGRTVLKYDLLNYKYK